MDHQLTDIRRFNNTVQAHHQMQQNTNSEGPKANIETFGKQMTPSQHYNTVKTSADEVATLVSKGKPPSEYTQ